MQSTPLAIGKAKQTEKRKALNNYEEASLNETKNTTRIKISVLIPCHNEEKGIKACIQSCINQTRTIDEIVVVNDGSTDNSLEILKSFGYKIKLVNLQKCSGNKSYAQEAGLKYITGDIFISTDADTILDKQVAGKLEEDFFNTDAVAVCGFVKSMRGNWLTACREIDYVVGQSIHKLAQSYIGFIMVIPGCVSAFRTDIFRKYIKFDHDTLTEDLDFTYKLNRKNLKIHFNPEVIVYTQDPDDLHSYIHQMKRWYAGGWQNLVKHLSIITEPAAAFELTLVYIEGLIFSIVLFVMPFINITYLGYIAIFSFATALFGAIYGAIKNKRIDLILYSPFYLILVPINSYIFLTEFFKVVIMRKRTLVWFTPKRRAIS